MIDYSKIDERPMMIGGYPDDLTPSFYVYGLLDPTSQEIKYIGQTKNPDIRLKTHMRGAKGNRKIAERAKYLKRQGLSFHMVILWRTWYRHHALHLEKIEISNRLEQGCTLFNKEGTLFKYKYKWDQLPQTEKRDPEIYHQKNIIQRGFSQWMNENNIKIFNIPLNIFDKKKIDRMKKTIIKANNSGITWWDYSQHELQRKQYFKTMNERLDGVIELVNYIENSTKDRLRTQEMKHDTYRRNTLKADLKLIKSAVRHDGFRFSVHHTHDLDELKTLYKENIDELKNRLLINSLHPTSCKYPPIRGPFHL